MNRHANMSRASRAVVLVTATGISVGLLSCTNSDEEMRRANVGPSGHHAIHSDQLQSAMRRLQHRSKEDIAAELYTGSPAQTDLRGVASAAAAIADTADHISEYLEGIEWAPGEQQRFLQLAQQLAGEARVVQAKAQAGDARAVQLAIRRMDNTCNACHTQFRF